MKIEKVMENLGKDLWKATKEDWVLEVHHVLTEPVYPTVYLYKESEPDEKIRVDEETIGKAIKEADRIARETILKDK